MAEYVFEILPKMVNKTLNMPLKASLMRAVLSELKNNIIDEYDDIEQKVKEMEEDLKELNGQIKIKLKLIDQWRH